MRLAQIGGRWLERAEHPLAHALRAGTKVGEHGSVSGFSEGHVSGHGLGTATECRFDPRKDSVVADPQVGQDCRRDCEWRGRDAAQSS